jgi:hypothetical protein
MGILEEVRTADELTVDCKHGNACSSLHMFLRKQP